MSDTPNDIDIEAERKLFEHVAAIPGLILTRHRHDYYRYADPMTDHCWYVHTERARIAAEREREMRYAADQHDLCCEQYGVGKSPDDPGDTLFERMNRWKALLKRQAEWKRRYYEVVKNYEDYVNAENEAVTKGIVKLETSLAASAEREREMQQEIAARDAEIERLRKEIAEADAFIRRDWEREGYERKTALKPKGPSNER